MSREPGKFAVIVARLSSPPTQRCSFFLFFCGLLSVTDQRLRKNGISLISALTMDSAGILTFSGEIIISELFLAFLTAVEDGNMEKICKFVSKEPIKWKSVVDKVCLPLAATSRFRLRRIAEFSIDLLFCNIIKDSICFRMASMQYFLLFGKSTWR